MGCGITGVKIAPVWPVSNLRTICGLWSISSSKLISAGVTPRRDESVNMGARRRSESRTHAGRSCSWRLHPALLQVKVSDMLLVPERCPAAGIKNSRPSSSNPPAGRILPASRGASRVVLPLDTRPIKTIEGRKSRPVRSDSTAVAVGRKPPVDSTVQAPLAVLIREVKALHVHQARGAQRRTRFRPQVHRHCRPRKRVNKPFGGRWYCFRCWPNKCYLPRSIVVSPLAPVAAAESRPGTRNQQDLHLKPETRSTWDDLPGLLKQRWKASVQDSRLSCVLI
jgi:hypothetical protein